MIVRFRFDVSVLESSGMNTNAEGRAKLLVRGDTSNRKVVYHILTEIAERFRYDDEPFADELGRVESFIVNVDGVSVE